MTADTVPRDDLAVMPRTARALDRCRQKGFTRSAQLSVRVTGEPVLAGTVGRTSLDTEPSARTAYVWNCGVKPLVAVMVAALVDDGEIGFDDRIRRYVPALSSGADAITVADLLTHQSGLSEAGATEFHAGRRDVHEGDRDAALAAANEALLRVDGEEGGDACYSVCTNWFLLSEMVEAVTAMPAEDAVRHRVIEPLQLTARLSLSRPEVGLLDRAPLEFEWANPATAMFQDDGDDVPDYELLDGSEPHFYMPGTSGFGPIADLVTVMDAVACDAVFGAGRILSQQTAREVTSARRVGAYDSFLKNDHAWGLGFTVDRRAFCPALSDATFGHIALGSSCIAFADPRCGVAAGVAFDCQLDGQAAVLRHAAVAGALVADLEELGILDRHELAESRSR